MPIAREILLARELLERAERMNIPHEKVAAYYESLCLFESCATESLTLQEQDLVTNLRRSYTRSLLAQLPAFMSVPPHDWVVFYLLLFKLEQEVDSIIQEDAELRGNYIRFLGLGITPEYERALGELIECRKNRLSPSEPQHSS